MVTVKRQGHPHPMLLPIALALFASGSTSDLALTYDRSGQVARFRVRAGVQLDDSTLFSMHGKELGLRDGDLMIVRAGGEGPNGTYVTQYQRQHDGVDVREPGIALVTKDGFVVSGVLGLTEKVPASAVPSVTATKARSIALDAAASWLRLRTTPTLTDETNPTLVIAEDGALLWTSEIHVASPQTFLVVEVDATTAAVVSVTDTALYAGTPVIVQGTDESGVPRDVYAEHFDSPAQNVMQYAPFAISTWDSHLDSEPAPTALPVTSATNFLDTSKYEPFVTVQHAMGATVDFFQSRGFPSIGEIQAFGGPATSFRSAYRPSCDCIVFAVAWDPSQPDAFTTDLGDTLCLDEMAHETTHAELARFAGFPAPNEGASTETRALAEAIADIFGMSIESLDEGLPPDWEVLEECPSGYDPADDQFRRFDHPTVSHPPQADVYNTSAFSQSTDPYVRAGPATLWFYLLSTGHPPDFDGAGFDAALELLTIVARDHYLTPVETYQSFASQTVDAAEAECTQTSKLEAAVTDAWASVGVLPGFAQDHAASPADVAVPPWPVQFEWQVPPIDVGFPPAVEVDTDPGFLSPDERVISGTLDASGTMATAEGSLLPDKEYYWRVVGDPLIPTDDVCAQPVHVFHTEQALPKPLSPLTSRSDQVHPLSAAFHWAIDPHTAKSKWWIKDDVHGYAYSGTLAAGDCPNDECTITRDLAIQSTITWGISAIGPDDLYASNATAEV